LQNKLVGDFREEPLFKFALLVGFLLSSPVIVFEFHDETLSGKAGVGCDLATGIDDGRVDQEAVFDAIEQRVAESGLAVLASEGAIGI
jgi:hypothetical protein